ncbi:MAG: HTH domain-containing protein [Acidimicrobiales bacterium]|nr:HTH domain-containing protein [Acidimicrobiales bacterium]
MNRLERLYAINERLRHHRGGPLSASRLADEFEVSRRTIERDLDALRRAGLPLYAAHGRTGGHHTLERGTHVVLTLSTSEVTALLVALTSAGPDMPFADAGATATRRLLDGLPTETRLEVDELRGRVRAAVGERPPAPARIRRTIEEAVRRSVVVNLVYVDRHGVCTSRPVEAVGLYDGGDGWYLVGWCRLRAAGRIFRFDRIDSARLTREQVARRDVDETLGWVPHRVQVP